MLSCTWSIWLVWTLFAEPICRAFLPRRQWYEYAKRFSLLPPCSIHSRIPWNHNHQTDELFWRALDNLPVDHVLLILDHSKRKCHERHGQDAAEAGTMNQNSRMNSRQNYWLAFLRSPFRERFDDRKSALWVEDGGNHGIPEHLRHSNYILLA